MIEKLLPNRTYAEETIGRSIVKMVSNRMVILILDFIFHRTNKDSSWFMIVSTIYTTLAYYFHERIWKK